MSSCDRRTFLALTAALAVAACGFEPAYGPGGAARELLGKVAIDGPTDKNGFDFVGRLEERLGRPEGATFALGYEITTKSVGLGITTSNAITRYEIVGSVGYTLRRRDSDQVVTSGTVKSFTSYSASGTVVSTNASERDAYVRLMRILADQVVTDLIAATSTPGAP